MELNVNERTYLAPAYNRLVYQGEGAPSTANDEIATRIYRPDENRVVIEPVRQVFFLSRGYLLTSGLFSSLARQGIQSAYREGLERAPARIHHVVQGSVAMPVRLAAGAATCFLGTVTAGMCAVIGAKSISNKDLGWDLNSSKSLAEACCFATAACLYSCVPSHIRDNPISRTGVLTTVIAIGAAFLHGAAVTCANFTMTPFTNATAGADPIYRYYDGQFHDYSSDNSVKVIDTHTGVAECFFVTASMCTFLFLISVVGAATATTAHAVDGPARRVGDRLGGYVSTVRLLNHLMATVDVMGAIGSRLLQSVLPL